MLSTCNNCIYEILFTKSFLIQLKAISTRDKDKIKFVSLYMFFVSNLMFLSIYDFCFEAKNVDKI